MRGNTIENAAGKWRPILAHFGLTSEQLSGKHTSCPLCGGKDRFRLDNKNGSGSYICNSCGSGYGIDLVQRLISGDFKDAAKAVDSIIGTVESEPVKKEKSVDDIRKEIKSILGQCSRIDEMEYLASRGIQSNPDVRFHKGLDYFEDGKLLGKFPAMIGIVRDVLGNGVAIHRTYLKKGGKADVSSPRKLSKSVSPIQGSAIRLYPATDVLGIAEGIETACSAHQLFDVPVWSCINATLMESFMPPESVKKLIIFADNDANFQGQKSAYILAHKMALKGLEVKVCVPQKVGDYNDNLLALLNK